MRPLNGLLLIAAIAAMIPLSAQQLERGDIVLTLVHHPVGGGPVSYIRIHGRDGAFKRELFTVDRHLSEPFYRDGIIYVGSRSPDGIERIDTAGNLLSAFSTQATGVNYLSPGPTGGLLAANGSGEIYQLAADGTLVHKRDFTSEIPAYGGIDLARDGCTAYYASAGLARWDACLHTEPTRFGPSLAGTYQALRLLPDGTFLIAAVGIFPAFDNKVMHVDEGGNLIRTYSIPGNALALDIDGMSFWTNAGNNLFHLDIATGQILGVKVLDYVIVGLSVVGEPRAGFAAATGGDVPAVSPGLLALLAAGLLIVALFRLRTS
jgi:hypothetical protein